MIKSKLHPGARWIFRFRAYWTLLFIVLFAFIFSISSIIKFSRGFSFSNNLLMAVIVYILIIIVFGEIFARMSYNRWFYEFTHDGLRIERGIVWKKYSNIPYEKIQNVDIHRGILARLLGFSTILIQTAGYSYSYGYWRTSHTEGYIPAVSIERAEEIRDFLMRKIGKKHSGGL